MSVPLQAAAAGAVLALIIFFVLQRLADRMETGNQGDQSRRVARLLRMVAYFDVLFLPVAIYVAMRSAGH